MNLPRRSFVDQVMGMPVSVHVRGPAARGEAVADLVASLYDRLRVEEEIFSPWRQDSAVCRIQQGQLSLADAPEVVREVADLCAEAELRTGGSFTAWLPAADGEPRFDPTGLVKGWAVGRAFSRLTSALVGLGEHDAMISAGGDIEVACAREDTPAWRIGIENPVQRSQTLQVLELRQGGVATSGTAARGEHILDPATGTPATGLASATVYGPKLIWADVYATAAFVKAESALSWIQTLPGYAGVLVGTDGVVHRS